MSCINSNIQYKNLFWNNIYENHENKKMQNDEKKIL
jgi:hypothetical protein